MKKTIIFSLLLLIISCNSSETHGIKINGAFTECQSFSENSKLINLIEKSLELDENAVLELTNFDCGGASHCYDLGSAITQIIYKVGEERFIALVSEFDRKQKSNLCGLIDVGLEYGFRLNIEKENLDFENQFPKLYKVLVENH